MSAWPVDANRVGSRWFVLFVAASATLSFAGLVPVPFHSPGGRLAGGLSFTTPSLSAEPAPAASVQNPAVGLPATSLNSSNGSFGLLATISTGTLGTTAVVDNATGQVYVMSQAAGSNVTNGSNVSYSANVTILNGTGITASVPIGLPTANGTFDSANGFVYAIVPWFVLNNSTNNTTYFTSGVAVLNGTTLEAIVPVAPYPVSIAYDAADGYVYVGGFNSPNLTVLNGTSVLATVPVASGGSTPTGVVYDPANGYVYAMTRGNGSPAIVVVQGTSVVAYVPLPYSSYPIREVVDPTNGYLYVALYSGSGVSVVSNTTLLTTISVGFAPSVLAADSSSGEVYVGGINWTNGTFSSPVVRVNGTSLDGAFSVPGFELSTLVFDPQNGYVCLLGTGVSGGYVGGSGRLLAVVGTTVVGTVLLGGNPIAAVYDAGTTDLYVVGALPPVVQVVGPGAFYPVTFQETGIPSGIDWNLTVDGVEMLLEANTTTFYLPNGTFPYVLGGLGPLATLYNFTWSESPLPYTGTVVVNGTGVVEPTLVFAVHGPNITVVFSQWGLPRGVAWNVTLSNATFSQTLNVSGNNTTIDFSVQPGNYSYKAGPVAGYYPTNQNSSGNLSVSYYQNGNGSYFSTYEWVPTFFFSRSSYQATVSETGLPAGFAFNVTVDGLSRVLSTDGATDTLNWTGLPNGTYPYTIANLPGWHQRTVPYAGLLTVDGGSAPPNGSGVGYSLTLAFTQVVYNVTFAELGLPLWTSWSLEVNSTIYPSTTGAITVELPNGTYPYTLPDLSGWHETTLPYGGEIGVQGSGLVEPLLVYVEVTYPVVFTETGLPTGTLWSVVAGSSILYSATSTITFEEPNGSLAYAVEPVPGYVANRTSGTASVLAGGASVAVTFAAPPSPAAPLVPSWVAPMVVGALAGGLVAGAVALVAVRKLRTGRSGRKDPSAVEPWEETEGKPPP